MIPSMRQLRLSWVRPWTTSYAQTWSLCVGLSLTQDERRFLADADPWGFIVFKRNIDTPGQLRGLVMSQTGILGLAAGILAIPVGVVLSVVMIYVVNKRSFGWTLRMELSPDVLLQAVGLALIGALVAGVYPAWRMSRTSPAAALRGE